MIIDAPTWQPKAAPMASNLPWFKVSNPVSTPQHVESSWKKLEAYLVIFVCSRPSFLGRLCDMECLHWCHLSSWREQWSCKHNTGRKCLMKCLKPKWTHTYPHAYCKWIVTLYKTSDYNGFAILLHRFALFFLVLLGFFLVFLCFSYFARFF